MPKKRLCYSNVPLIRVFTASTNLAAGALSIVLVCQRQGAPCFNEAALITLIVGLGINAFLHGLLVILENRALNAFSVASQLLVLGCAIWHIKFLVEKLPESRLSHRQINLTVAHMATILTTMFSGSLPLSPIDTNSSCKHQHTGDDLCEYETKGRSYSNHATKTVLMKNSAQTLTPDADFQENYAQQNWMNQYPSTYSGSDNGTASVVVKHPVEQQICPRRSATSCEAEQCSQKRSKRLKFDVLGKFKGKVKADKHLPSTDPNSCYVTRLSTIQDNSKSILDVARASQHLDVGSRSGYSNSLFNDGDRSESHNKSLYMTGRNPLLRINSALLPPPLPSIKSEEQDSTSTNGSHGEYTPPPTVICEESSNILFENGLEDIPQIPEWNSSIHRPKAAPKLLKGVGLQDWQANGAQLLENERRISASNPTLLPGFPVFPKEEVESKADFSFPLTKPTLDFDRFLEPGQEHTDAVSELDDLLNQENPDEGQRSDANETMTTILREDDRSVQINRNSRRLSFASGNHSPAKSLNSLFTVSANGSFKYPPKALSRSPTKSPTRFSTKFTNAGHSFTSNHNYHHSRSSSQLISPLYSAANVGNINHSTNSSPTRSGRLRNSFSKKKLSLSNISLKLDEEDGMRKHTRGNSIDFSYLHTLQNKHSPSKSISSTARRNSAILPNERNIRTVSALFLAGEEAYRKKPMLDFDCTVHATDSDQSDNLEQSSRLSCVSKSSDTQYPQALIGEYDREKWSTLVSMSLIQDQNN